MRFFFYSRFKAKDSDNDKTDENMKLLGKIEENFKMNVRSFERFLSDKMRLPVTPIQTFFIAQQNAKKSKNAVSIARQNAKKITKRNFIFR